MPVLLLLVPLIASDEHKGSSDGVWGPGQGMREIGTDQVSGSGSDSGSTITVSATCILVIFCVLMQSNNYFSSFYRVELTDS